MSTPTSTQNALIDFLKSFPEIDPDKIEAIAAAIPVIDPKKGTILVKEGEIPKACYFVLKGMIREYVFDDGNDRTIGFYTETHGTVSSDHFTNQTPSDRFLECAEDCLLIAGDRESDQSNYESFPELAAITRNMLEADLNQTKKNFTYFVLASPKERYLQLLESRPDLFQRAPLHQIASYLGMTAESLSRIRKRIIPNSI
ncbi:MAG: Crp/Fnr family transcriptional regulator [Bacteroidetes bacterium]|nr:Crp/Fnr family transcriptional regulator [Bacteroidota bacterium]